MENKTCNDCKIEKSIINFRKESRRIDGYATRCKICQDLKLTAFKSRPGYGKGTFRGNKKWKELDKPKKSTCSCEERSYYLQRAHPCTHQYGAVRPQEALGAI